MQNDDPILRYYEAEMRYLRESGKAFARAHPDRARMLNIDRVGDLDPYVERLHEGFAFLTGRLRQKLDDELPELTEGLVSLLWPHYLRMIPSLSVVELMPIDAKLQNSEQVAAGVVVRSAPIVVPAEREGAAPTTLQCEYRTTQPVGLHPIALTHAEPDVRHDGRSVIRIGFSLDPTARREETDLSRLRLYLSAELPTAFAMHLALTRQIDDVLWRVPEVRNGEALPLAGVTVEPAGFSAQERLWPKADNAFSGYQLLLEYFTFREKFLFVDLCGFNLAQLPEAATTFELEFVLSQAFPRATLRCQQCAPVLHTGHQSVRARCGTDRHQSPRVRIPRGAGRTLR